VRSELKRKTSKQIRHAPSGHSSGDTGKGVKLDETDRLILSLLQENARISNVDIARRVGMVPSGILERLRKLKKNKVILSYETRLDARAVGLGLTAFVFVKTKEVSPHPDTADRLGKIAAVQEVHNITGEDCYLVKMRVANPQELGRVLRDQVGSIPSVLSTKTTIALDTFKETTAVPILTNRTK
jgi:Lrp/AsnC family leucine-responsive transcriptional regulator